MIQTKLAAPAACLFTAGASAADDFVTRAQRTQLSGDVRFRQQGYKLFADVDVGWKYETEVTPVDGGFVCMLSAGPRKYVEVDDAFQAIVGTYIYTILPPR